jgi:hypothetical protein
MDTDINRMSITAIIDYYKNDEIKKAVGDLCEIINKLFNLAYHDEGLIGEVREKAKKLLPHVILRVEDSLTEYPDKLLYFRQVVAGSFIRASMTGIGSYSWTLRHDSEGMLLSNAEVGERTLNSAEGIAATLLVANLEAYDPSANK